MQWQLWREAVLVGELSEYGCDQPFFLARFTPGPGWENERELFEALAAARSPDPDGSQFVAAIKPLQGLELRPAEADSQAPPLRVFRNCVLHINGSQARLRY
ncbi:hypothetical protein [Streptomyces sp. NRRL F-5123]|uniref:hypothetical protein n=1 Tax=Streptomyces sp. NRRL F-5123 TaxID=1463856 RepID=UPI00099C72FF|nr:hypothetical protein [Streptomyces sp. NRRL F-5123]